MSMQSLHSATEFHEFDKDHTVTTADGTIIPAVGKGSVEVEAKVDGKREKIMLRDVWLVPSLTKNLFSPLAAHDRMQNTEFTSKTTECKFDVDEGAESGDRNITETEPNVETEDHELALEGDRVVDEDQVHEEEQSIEDPEDANDVILENEEELEIAEPVEQEPRYNLRDRSQIARPRKLEDYVCGVLRGISSEKTASESATSGGAGNNENYKSFDDIPGPKSYPVIGTLYKYFPLIGDYSAETLDKNAWLTWRRYGSIARERPGIRLLHVFDPDDIAAVFRQDDRYPARRSHLAMQHYRLSKPHLYNTGGLLSTNGPEWWRLRSTFQKNFTSPQSVRGHVETTDGVVREFVSWIKEMKVSENDDFLAYLNRLNLEVIGLVAFNERFNSFSPSQQDPKSRSSRTIAAAFFSNSGIMKLDKGVLWRLFRTPLYKKLADSQDYLAKVATEILYQRVTLRAKEEVIDKSLLASFIQQPNLDLKDITGMMVDILMAAIDTTAYSTAFALYHLSRNLACQEKLHKEAVTLLPSKDSVLTAETLSKASYVRSCVKESLRLNPVSIGVGRLLQKDIVLKGYLIPKGTAIVTQNMVACRLPQYVREPLQFKPERWLRGSPEHENLHPFSSLPFGFGPRSCIARRLAEQNICITLLRMFREFDVKWTGGELGIQTFLINKPDQPVLLKFTPK
ncbi:cytochrome p450 domain-containing protein [Phthorimaea operculella]|nr:cytochrome p450 domain-containing protein [Phthorimaea operculella]